MSEFSSVDEPASGVVIDGKYRLSEKLGAGGMGSVFEAVHIVLGRKVAVKILNRVDEVAVRRFERECRLLSKVTHPSIPKLYGWGVTENGCPYLAMELIHGETLQSMLDRETTLEPDTVRAFGISICDGLEVVHRQGIVHRDIKPSNLLVQESEDGSATPTVAIMDLGIAVIVSDDVRVTQTKSVAGTIDYMSPEHLRPDSLETRSDIFSLGGVMFRCLAGQPPFCADSPMATAMKLQSNERGALPDTVPQYLRVAIERCLAPNPQDRFESVADLKDVLQNRTVVSLAPSQRTSIKKTRSPSSMVLTLLVLGSFAIIVLTLFIFMDRQASSDVADGQTDQINRYSNSIPPGLSAKDEYDYIVALEKLTNETKLALLKFRLQQRLDSRDIKYAIAQRRLLAGYLRSPLQRYPESIAELREALALARSRRDSKPLVEARVLIEIGETNYLMRDPATAAQYFSQAVQLLQGDNADSLDFAIAKNGLGESKIKLEQFESAASDLMAAQKIFENHCDWAKQSFCIGNLLEIDAGRGNYGIEEDLQAKIHNINLRVNSPQIFTLAATEVASGAKHSTELPTMVATFDAFDGLIHLKDEDRAALSSLALHVSLLKQRAGDAKGVAKYLSRAVSLAEKIDEPARRFQQWVTIAFDEVDSDLAIYRRAASEAIKTLRETNISSMPNHWEIVQLSQLLRERTDRSDKDLSLLVSDLVPWLKQRTEAVKDGDLKLVFACSYLELSSKENARSSVEFGERIRDELSNSNVNQAHFIRLLAILSSHYERTGDMNNATLTLESAYRRAIQTTSVNEEARGVTARHLGDIYIRSKRPYDALPLFKKSREHMLNVYREGSARKIPVATALKHTDWATIGLANLYRNLHQKEEAIKVCREEMELWRAAGQEGKQAAEVRRQLKLAEEMP